MEYLDLARNVASGRGFVSTLRTYFVGPEGLPQPPQIVRPVLFPLLGGLAYALAPDPRVLQVLNLVLGAAALALTYAMVLRFGRGVAALTVLALAVSPAFGRDVTLPMSEASALLAVLGAVALADRAGGRPSRCAAVGLWLGLAYLARPATLPLAAAVAAHAALGGAVGGGLRALAVVVAAACLAASPLWLLNLRHGLPLLWTPASFTYATLDYELFMWDGYGRVPQSALAIVRAHPVEVLTAIARNAIRVVRMLFLEPQRLGILLLVWPAAWWAACHAPAPQRRLAVLLAALAALSALLYAATWSDTMQERYVSLSFVLLLPLAIFGLATVARHTPAPSAAFWAPGLLLVTAFACGTLETNRRQAREVTAGHTRAFWDPSSAEGSPAARAASWLDARLPREAAVAATNPWIFAFLLDRPTVLLPRDLDAGEMARFVGEHGVRAVINLEDERTGTPPGRFDAVVRKVGGRGPVPFGRNAVYLLPPSEVAGGAAVADPPRARSRKNSS